MKNIFIVFYYCYKNARSVGGLRISDCRDWQLALWVQPASSVAAETTRQSSSASAPSSSVQRLAPTDLHLHFLHSKVHEYFSTFTSTHAIEVLWCCLSTHLLHCRHPRSSAEQRQHPSFWWAAARAFSFLEVAIALALRKSPPVSPHRSPKSSSFASTSCSIFAWSNPKNLHKCWRLKLFCTLTRSLQPIGARSWSRDRVLRSIHSRLPLAECLLPQLCAVRPRRDLKIKTNRYFHYITQNYRTYKCEHTLCFPTVAHSDWVCFWRVAQHPSSWFCSSTFLVLQACSSVCSTASLSWLALISSCWIYEPENEIFVAIICVSGWNFLKDKL